jgi:hypothetical protein
VDRPRQVRAFRVPVLPAGAKEVGKSASSPGRRPAHT